MEYGLIGEKLGHSFSKTIHSLIGSYDYSLREVARDDLDAFMRKRDFKGINVTIPYKTEVIPYLDSISAEAEKIGSVNTIVNESGRLRGFNTDFFGLKMLIERQKTDLKGRNALILGTGGTSRTAKAVLESLGVAQVYQASRNPAQGMVGYDDIANLRVDHVINTTPVGMFPNSDSSPIELDKLKHINGITDVIYNPLRTNLVLSGKKRGISSSGGLFMLVAQAVHAARLFGFSSADDEQVSDIYRRILSQKTNIVLIGMPSCGKTTIGHRVSKGLARSFVDTDQRISAKLSEMGIGMRISEYIAERGEQSFREIETEVIRDVSRLNGVVIATGGGAVLNPENMRMLRQNGIVFWIDRPLELLKATTSRPLTSTREALERKYAERSGLYEEHANVRVRNDALPDDAVEAIVRGFNNEIACD